MNIEGRCIENMEYVELYEFYIRKKVSYVAVTDDGIFIWRNNEW